jgi:hypothetical protein
LIEAKKIREYDAAVRPIRHLRDLGLWQGHARSLSSACYIALSQMVWLWR